MATIRINAKDAPGLIYIERNKHDEAIVISGTLNIDNASGELNALIAQELETAARGINDNGGLIGHIKAAVTATATDMISVTEEKAMVKTSPFRSARITLTVIVFLIEPEKAEAIARKTLVGIRKRCRG